MRLSRAHGLGNDYLVLADGSPLTPSLVRAVCDRHEGVGGDGILEPVPAMEGADYGLRIHNPDGSEAEKSGNGLRIYAHWLVRARGAPPRFTVWTPGGVVRCEVDKDHVRVAMGVAKVGAARVVEGVEAWPVDVGNPHHVVFAAPEDWRALGSSIERSVPARTNVQFVAGLDPVRVKVWERGAGETKSSGSSACAVAAVVVARGLRASPVEVHMDGGVLTVAVGPGGDVDLAGPVEAIAEIEVDAAWSSRRS